MKLPLGRAVALIALVGVSFAGGAWWTRRAPDLAAAQGRQAVTYACPMHPQYRSDHPADCGICGMRLEAVKTNDAASPSGSRLAVPAGAVQVSAERQQAVGVRLGVAERVSGTRMLRTTGRVAPNENATYPIVAGVSGWIRDVHSATTGSQVRKNELLATFYSPELVGIQQSYYAGLETVDRAGNLQIQTYNDQRIVEGVQRFADTLRNMGISDLQLAEMRRKRELVQDIYLLSPVDGFVLQRSVAPGLRFDRGFELYRIADLRRVWILADIYEHQLPFIRRGASARVTTTQENRQFGATISATEPIFDEATLTLKVRLEASNPGLLLKPGMFVDVEFPIELPDTLIVPADAIVDSGLRKTVFVDLGAGYFEPRQVETGWRIDDQVEIVKGLMPGERIVISGTFLIDSESRMKAAAQGIFGTAAEDPVCGMQVDEQRAAAAGRTAEHAQTTYYFCADECKRRFLEEPGRFVGKPSPQRAPSHAPKASAKPHETQPHAVQQHPAGPDQGVAGETDTAVDPICQMTVTKKDAVAAGRTSTRDGRTFYFCSDPCKKKFDEGQLPETAPGAAAKKVHGVTP
jgi:RND family efflux transporter MFP subunit